MANVTDLHLMHWFGANALRTSHYPYAEEFYDLCDREGILVIDETPAVGINGAARDPYKTYPLAGHHRQVLADMIARDKNHPCAAGGTPSPPLTIKNKGGLPPITSCTLFPP